MLLAKTINLDIQNRMFNSITNRKRAGNESITLLALKSFSNEGKVQSGSILIFFNTHESSLSTSKHPQLLDIIISILMGRDKCDSYVK